MDVAARRNRYDACMAGRVVIGARTAFVTTVSPLTVTPAGESTAHPALVITAYTPVVADRVAVIPLDTSKLLVLGKVA